MSQSSVRARRACAALGAVSLAAFALTSVASAAAAASSSSGINPYSPAAGHPYRHGTLPTLGTLQKMKNYASTHPSVAATTGPKTLSYGGGIDGIGVQSGHSKVYLVFYGTQWGIEGNDANFNMQFTGDPDGAAGAAQQMFEGIGTNNELWSADLTQWCDGAGVAAGATACPASGASYIPYQSGGVLAGAWYDDTQASPAAATAAQLGQEAVNAAAHFGNTTAASNRYAYYVILSPHGTNPDNYFGSYCAWHNYNSAVGVSSPYGDIAFSNQPYNMDYGAGCGVGFVNSPGTLDGWTITLGHEWHEMMSDQNPAGGWTNHVVGSSYNGQENSDECAWISPGQPGGAANVSFGVHGTYAEQASWSNDTNNCAISHAIINHGTSGVTVANPGNQTGTVGTAKSLQMSASGGTAPYTWSATGLPAGMSINASTGLISGTPTTAATYSVTVTAKDTSNATGTASFSWTITSSGGGGNEVLGCAFGSDAWTANSCVEAATNGFVDVAHFVPHNLSGSYTMSWTVTGPNGALSNCSTGTYNCISGGCTSTSTTCDLTVRTGNNDHTYTASLTLTQSGVTKTISASALVQGDPTTCPKC